MIPKILLALIAFSAGLHAQVTVANGASFDEGKPLSAGSFAVAVADFMGATAEAAQSLPLPTSLGGVTVKVNGIEAPLHSVSLDLYTDQNGSQVLDQVNFLIPYGVGTGLQTVEVTFPNGSVSEQVAIVSAAPGLFVNFGAGGSTPAAAVLNASQGIGDVVNTSSMPALKGEVVALFGTGQGPLDRDVSDGTAPGLPLANTTGDVEVYLGGRAIPADFSGLNVDFPGLWQINITIPQDLAIQGQVPLTVYVNGVDSNEVSIFVQ